MPNDRGFTLIELLMALGILTAVLVALGIASGHFVREATLTERRTAASELADSRIDEIQMFPVYRALDTAFAGSETGFPTLPGYIRTTTVTHVGGLGQTNDFKRITVTVVGPGVTPPVSRTITVAAP